MWISRQRTMSPSTKTANRAGAKLVLETLVLIWALVVNLLYYAQFKALFISRLGHFIHRWR
jgi:hypothetical protein